MPLVTLDGLHRKRPEPGWASCCFGVCNLEILCAAVGAAEDESAPTAVSIDPGATDRTGMRALAEACLAVARDASVPVAVHLNHARSLDLIMWALDVGFTSVMLDGSARPFAENLALTRRAVQIASEAGASVEGELPAPETGRDVDRAVEFVRLSGAGYLAVTVDARGLDLDLLARLAGGCTARLALHGASRLAEGDLAQAIRGGVRKVNVHTELNRAFRHGVQDALAGGGGDLRDVLDRGAAQAREAARAALRRCGAAGMA